MVDEKNTRDEGGCAVWGAVDSSSAYLDGPPGCCRSRNRCNRCRRCFHHDIRDVAQNALHFERRVVSLVLPQNQLPERTKIYCENPYTSSGYEPRGPPKSWFFLIRSAPSGAIGSTGPECVTLIRNEGKHHILCFALHSTGVSLPEPAPPHHHEASISRHFFNGLACTCECVVRAQCLCGGGFVNFFASTLS